MVLFRRAVLDCCAVVWKTTAYRKADQRRDDPCAVGLRKRGLNAQRLAAAIS